MNKKLIKNIIVILIGITMIIIGIIIHNTTSTSSISLKYKYFGEISDDKIAVSDGKKYWYYDLQNKKDTNKYQMMEDMKIDDSIDLSNIIYNDGIGVYGDKIYYGLIDNQGEKISEPLFEKIQINNKNSIMVFRFSKYYIINKDLKEQSIKSDYYTNIENSNLTIMEENNIKYIYNRKDNSVVLKTTGDIKWVSNEDTNYIAISSEDGTKNYLYNKKANKIKVIEQSSNLFPVSMNDKYIVYSNTINNNNIYDIKNNKFIILTGNYIAVEPLYENLSLVINSEMKTGYIDEQEKTVIPFEYDFLNNTSFDDGIAIVSKNNKIGAIDKNNKTIISFSYDELTKITNNLFIAIKNKKTILINKEEKELSDEYDSIAVINKKIIAKKDKMYYLLDERGKEKQLTTGKEIKIINDYILIEKSNKSIEIFYISK